ncbi:hypothetical protein Vadar_005083 [Vaccinium darrowii]|uniref:Uncharacterized protein n=1 Tax=Vaccinium darrowii TaxID=229202 RepID=A0ACB7Z9N6_9ERIC|nr:hypothetical protein Vadar_005083 [Vaccinium darrowii]
MVKAVVEGPSPLQKNPLHRNEINKSRAYANRKGSIKKKTRELSILCGITACTVIVCPNGKVDTWPENPTVVKSIIDRYKERMGKKSPQPSEFTGEKINLDEFLSGWKDDWLCGLSREVLGTFLSDLESKLRAMERRIEVLNVMNYEQRNPQQGKSIVSSNDYAQLGPLQEVHSTACGWFYYPLYVQPLNCYRPSDQSDEECDDCTRQFFPTAAIDSQPRSSSG